MTAQATGTPVDGSVADGELVRRAREGDQGAFDVLFRRHYARLVHLALRLHGNQDDAEDIVQTAFVRAYAHLKRIRDGQALLAWLYRAVVNLVRDRAKSAVQRQTVALEAMSQRPDGDASEEPAALGDASLDPARVVEKSEVQRALAEAIQRLPLEFREPLVLHHLEHLGVEEIAQVLGVPVGTVKSRIARGRMRLRRELEPWFPGGE